MDSLFEVLIVLLILYSLISPFFKKRPMDDESDAIPPPEKKHPQTMNREMKTSSYKDKTDSDIFGEIEKIFKQQEPIVIHNPEHRRSPREIKKVEHKRINYDKATKSEYVKEDVTRKRNTEINFDRSATFDKGRKPVTQNLPQLISQSRLGESKKVIDLRKKINDTNSLKNFVLISEILAKPKALRHFS
ncbi:MAG: hypothetical protein C0425_00340 [Chlorobiaceae bacterium]|nr:hypothetical protein [Chlorobiaceae bacterium]MBA4308772.1 hypothetical protein [Chlorobiaceae bacterium]